MNAEAQRTQCCAEERLDETHETMTAVLAKPLQCSARPQCLHQDLIPIARTGPGQPLPMNLCFASRRSDGLTGCGAPEPTPSPLQGGERAQRRRGISSVAPRATVLPQFMGSKCIRFWRSGLPMNLWQQSAGTKWREGSPPSPWPSPPGEGMAAVRFGSTSCPVSNPAPGWFRGSRRELLVRKILAPPSPAEGEA